METIELLQGDCLELMKTIPDGSIDCVVTDPPYKIITGGDSNGKNSIRPKGILKGNRELMRTVPKFSEWLPELFRVLKDGTQNYVMVNSSNLLKMSNEIEDRYNALLMSKSLVMLEMLRESKETIEWLMNNCSVKDELLETFNNLGMNQMSRLEDLTNESTEL